MKKMKKKNNKGFSLIELIVVVLIMAVIAVALAPQVMKWFGESQDSVDANNAATIESSIQIAITEPTVYNAINALGSVSTMASSWNNNDTDHALTNTNWTVTGSANTTLIDAARDAFVVELETIIPSTEWPLSESGTGFNISITCGESPTVSVTVQH